MKPIYEFIVFVGEVIAAKLREFWLRITGRGDQIDRDV